MKNRVYFEDTGGVYDAPLQVVWDFILHDKEFHPQAHQHSLRNFRWKDVNETTGIASCEVHRVGRWMKMTARITTIPPVARIHEELTGRYARTKVVFLYTPKGKRTGTDVYAELASDTVSPEELKNEWRQTLTAAFNEDVLMLQKFVQKRNRKGARK